MRSPWEHPDFDDHEAVHFFTDPNSGLRLIIAVHSTALGPASGGVRFWHYGLEDDPLGDALRLSRGMSYKSAMAGLAAGGGKAVILAPPDRMKTPALLAAFGRSVEKLGGAYVTAADVGITVDDLVTAAGETSFISGLPAPEGSAGGDSGPHTALGVFLGIKAAVRRALGREDLGGVHIAIQGAGSVGGGLARLAAAEGARLSIADLDRQRARSLADELGAVAVDASQIMTLEADVLSPCALGAILNEASIPELRVAVVAGGANNQLTRPEDGRRLLERNILYAPDYVINAGGIINVVLEYQRNSDVAEVRRRVEQIPVRLESIWEEGTRTGRDPATVADAMAQRLIERG